MQVRNTVYGESVMDIDVCHVYTAVFDDCNGFVTEFLVYTVVQFVNDRH